jgi:4-amino-4-deoxy-L-arabinose transferase-like glycosyltransferase
MIWIFAILPFLGWWLTGLFDVDEGFYAAVVAEMLKSGDYITPMYNGLPWFEKPILLYWAAVPTILSFGEMVGPRLPSVLASLATMAMCAKFLSVHFGPSAAKRVVLVLATSLLFVALGRMMMLDPLMVLFLTGAMLAFAQSLVGSERWRWAAGASLGFAVLAKGPVSVAFFVALLVWTYAAEPQLRTKMKGGWIGFTVGFLASCLSWYLPAYLATPKEFIDIFIIKHNIRRLMGGDDAHRVPTWAYLPYYFVVLGVLFAPWWWHTLKGWPKKGGGGEAGPTLLRLFARWGLIVFVLFTLSGTKLPHYILPAVIPFALLAAVRLGERDGDRGIPRLAFTGCILASIVMNWAQWFYYKDSGQAQAHAYAMEYRDQGVFATYQLRARKRDVSLKARVQETSLP